MILTTHALTGAVIGKNISNPWIIIPVSLAIHYLMDSIKHAEYFDSRVAKIKDTWWKVAIDLAIGFSIIFSFFYLEKSSFIEMRNMLIGIFFSLFPDFITLLHWKFRENKLLAEIKKLHSWSHRYGKYPKYSPERQWNFKNATNDIVISLIAIVFLFI
ncbi:MAG TPA: hypothetical protein PLK35_02620 [Candidatus Moranbacteria bacterium]|nr:hypothetical protein [Candidatus Moranbacteria bacterium]